MVVLHFPRLEGMLILYSVRLAPRLPWDGWSIFGDTHEHPLFAIFLSCFYFHTLLNPNPNLAYFLYFIFCVGFVSSAVFHVASYSPYSRLLTATMDDLSELLARGFLLTTKEGKEVEAGDDTPHSEPSEVRHGGASGFGEELLRSYVTTKHRASSPTGTGIPVTELGT